MVRRRQEATPARPAQKSAVLVGGEIVRIDEEREPVETYGQTFIWCEVLGVVQNPWLVNTRHIMRIEP